MARLLTVTFILIMFSQAAFAVVDPRPDVLGVYFDEYGDQICNDLVFAGIPFSVWIVYTNPTPTSILGFEAGFYPTGNSLIRLEIHPPCQIMWIDPDLENLQVVCPTPLPTAQATPLFRIDYIFVGVPESTFHLEKASGSSLPGDNPYIILADGSPLEVQPGDPAFTAMCCGVPAVNVGWGTIKSLYR